jgi:hypothetical protein
MAKSNWSLSVTKDRFTLVDNRNGFILAQGRIDGSGCTRGIELASEVHKSNVTRLAVLRAIGDASSKEAVLARAMVYYRAEMQAAKELGKVAFVEELAIWAQAAIERRHWSVKLPA